MNPESPSKICFCGNDEKNHNFRHEFEGKVNVAFGTMFLLRARDYPEEQAEICGFPKCSIGKSLHRSLYTREQLELLNKETQTTHEYVPLKIVRRKVNFTLPLNTCCSLCFQPLSSHSSQHIFQAPVRVVGLEKYDQVNLRHPTNIDFKIVQGEFKTPLKDEK